MTLKKLGCYAALAFENCHSKEPSSDSGSLSMLSDGPVGCEVPPHLWPGLTELPVEFITVQGSASGLRFLPEPCGAVTVTGQLS